jgi:tetratricopeptide (TPR) repeat protein
MLWPKAVLWLLIAALAAEDADALMALDKQVAASPSSAVPRLDAAALRLKAGEQLDHAMLDIDVAMSLAPENPRAHYLFGQLMEEKGEVESAKRCYLTALALRDDYDDARFRLAGLLMREGAFAEAAQAYGRYTKTHPDATGARLQLASALEQSGDKQGAEKELKALYAAPASKLIAGRKLAELYDRLGKPKEAAKVRDAVDPPKPKLRELKRSAR